MTNKQKQYPLQQIIKDFPEITVDPRFHGLSIQGLALDSRLVETDFLFAALKGNKVSGTSFIPAALAAGASVILCDDDADTSPWPDTCFIKSSNPRKLFSELASKYYDKTPAVIAAVTGTNGKTSIVHFCREIWKRLGKHAASVGTVGIEDSHGKIEFDRSNFLTTPDPVKLRKIISQLAEGGVTHMAMEASSHGLDQYRLDGLPVGIGAFTNLTRDHMDYHGSFENYLKAKMRLFDSVMAEGSIAVLNADIPEFSALKEACDARRHTIMSYGKYRQGQPRNTIDILSLTTTSEGQQIAFEILGKVYHVNTHLIGEFQAYNLLCALAMVIASGANVDEAVEVLADIPCVPGRMEKVARGVYVDYAHTPDALEKALTVMRQHSKGTLWAVFGCGGDRDTGKRPIMGEIAGRLADHVIVTDDNPRTENPAAIRAAILATAGQNAIEIPDRRVAIRKAVRALKPGDMVLLAGKGHEKTQTVGAEVLPFDDVKVAMEEMV